MATAKWPVDLPADLVEEGLDQPDRGLGVVAGGQMGDEAGQVPHASDWAVVESASRDRAAGPRLGSGSRMRGRNIDDLDLSSVSANRRNEEPKRCSYVCQGPV